MAKEVRSLLSKIESSSEEISDSAFSSGIGIAKREHAGESQKSDLLGIDAVIFDLGSVDSFHVEGMT